MPSDNPNAYVYQIQQGNATFLNATDITDADRERADQLHEHWFHLPLSEEIQGSLDDAWIHTAAYERMMCENANEVARLKHAAVAAPVDELPPHIAKNEEYARYLMERGGTANGALLPVSDLLWLYDELRAANATIVQLRAHSETAKNVYDMNLRTLQHNHRVDLDEREQHWREENAQLRARVAELEGQR